jgi:hypothetical protein
MLKQINRGFQAKGWNLYEMVIGVDEDGDESHGVSISYGAVDSLERGTYAVLPRIAAHDNSQEIIQTIHVLDLGNIKPRMIVDNLSVRVSAVSFEREYVQIINNRRIRLPYKKFVDCLGSLNNIRAN